MRHFNECCDSPTTGCWPASRRPFLLFSELDPLFAVKNFSTKKLFSRLFERTEMCFGAQEPQPLKIRHNHLFIDNLDFLLRLGRRIFGHWTGRWAWAWVRGLIEAKYRDIDPLCVVNFALFFSFSLYLFPWQNGKMFPFLMQQGNQRPIWPIRLKSSIRWVTFTVSFKLSLSGQW